MTALDVLTTPTPVAPGAFTIEIPDGWQQGRGAFGGLVLAILARAADATVADPARTLRSLTGEIVGPVQPGASEIKVEILRAGSGVTTAAVRLIQAGEVQAHAVAALGKPRGDYQAAPALAPFDPPPWRDVRVAPVGPPMAPTFVQHMEMRPLGPTPFSGSPSAIASGWVRPKEPGARRDPAYAIAMVDAWWPANLAAERAPRPMATLTFAFAMVRDLDGLDPDAPLYYRGAISAGHAGYAVEQRELWGEDGRLIAVNQQTFVVMR
jgi:acyl-CoA thioesterase